MYKSSSLDALNETDAVGGPDRVLSEPSEFEISTTSLVKVNTAPRSHSHLGAKIISAASEAAQVEEGAAGAAVPELDLGGSNVSADPKWKFWKHIHLGGGGEGKAEEEEANKGRVGRRKSAELEDLDLDSNGRPKKKKRFRWKKLLRKIKIMKAKDEGVDISGAPIDRKTPISAPTKLDSIHDGDGGGGGSGVGDAEPHSPSTAGADGADRRRESFGGKAFKSVHRNNPLFSSDGSARSATNPGGDSVHAGTSNDGGGDGAGAETVAAAQKSDGDGEATSVSTPSGSAIKFDLPPVKTAKTLDNTAAKAKRGISMHQSKRKPTRKVSARVREQQQLKRKAAEATTNVLNSEIDDAVIAEGATEDEDIAADDGSTTATAALGTGSGRRKRALPTTPANASIASPVPAFTAQATAGTAPTKPAAAAAAAAAPAVRRRKPPGGIMMGGNQRLSMNIASELKGLLSGGRGRGGRGRGGSVVGRGGGANKALTKFAQTAAQQPNTPDAENGDGNAVMAAAASSTDSRTLADGTIAPASLLVVSGMQTLQKNKSKGMLAEMSSRLGIEDGGGAAAAGDSAAGATTGGDPQGEEAEGAAAAALAKLDPLEKLNTLEKKATKSVMSEMNFKLGLKSKLPPRTLPAAPTTAPPIGPPIGAVQSSPSSGSGGGGGGGGATAPASMPEPAVEGNPSSPVPVLSVTPATPTLEATEPSHTLTVTSGPVTAAVPAPPAATKTNFRKKFTVRTAGAMEFMEEQRRQHEMEDVRAADALARAQRPTAAPVAVVAPAPTPTPAAIVAAALAPAPIIPAPAPAKEEAVAAAAAAAAAAAVAVAVAAEAAPAALLTVAVDGEATRKLDSEEEGDEEDDESALSAIAGGNSVEGSKALSKSKKRMKDKKRPKSKAFAEDEGEDDEAALTAVLARLAAEKAAEEIEVEVVVRSFGNRLSSMPEMNEEVGEGEEVLALPAAIDEKSDSDGEVMM